MTIIAYILFIIASAILEGILIGTFRGLHEGRFSSVNFGVSVFAVQLVYYFLHTLISSIVSYKVVFGLFNIEVSSWLPFLILTPFCLVQKNAGPLHKAASILGVVIAFLINLFMN